MGDNVFPLLVAPSLKNPSIVGIYCNWIIFPTRWGPPVISWLINPINYSYLRTINHSDIGVMFTNLVIERGHHLVVI